MKNEEKRALLTNKMLKTFNKKMFLTNSQNQSNQMKKFLSKITVFM